VRSAYPDPGGKVFKGFQSAALTEHGVIRSRSRLSESYASLWKPWKLVKTMDKNQGSVSKQLETPP